MKTQKAGDKTPEKRSYPKARRPNLSVSEKIFKAQYESPFDRKGPELELFFHELTDKEPRGKQIFDFVFAALCFPLLVILFPFIAAGIKLSSRGPVVNKIKTVGKAGTEFMRYEFRTTYNKNASDKEYFLLGRLLHASGIYKLPSIINIFKKQMSVVGPMAYREQESVHWNNIFDDFFKRYAVRPGIISVHYLDEQDQKQPSVKQQLKREFKYLVSPTFKNDLKVIFGNF